MAWIPVRQFFGAVALSAAVTFTFCACSSAGEGSPRNEELRVAERLEIRGLGPTDLLGDIASAISSCLVHLDRNGDPTSELLARLPSQQNLGIT